MSQEAFIEWLAGLDRKAYANLRRSLAFDLGTYPPAFPYVEQFIPEECSDWRRGMYYLVAGLFALHGAKDSGAVVGNMGNTIKQFYLKKEELPSIEARFVTLLDADEEQLAYRLRQMAGLLDDCTINWQMLLKHLLAWNSYKRWVQQAWAKDFYRRSGAEKNLDADKPAS